MSIGCKTCNFTKVRLFFFFFFPRLEVLKKGRRENKELPCSEFVTVPFFLSIAVGLSLSLLLPEDSIAKHSMEIS